MPWLIALRVVSLPATTSRMKNEPNSWAVSWSPSTSAAIITDVMSSLRVGPAVLAERLGVHEHLERVRHQVLERADELGVADAEDRVRPLEDLRVVLGRDAHHVADDLEGQGGGDVLDEVALLVGELLEQAVDDLGGLDAHVVLDAADLLGREALRHDRAEAEVLRVVHVDHRAEELVHLLGEIADVRALARAEQLGVAADLPDVLVAASGRSSRDRGGNGESSISASSKKGEAGRVAHRLERPVAVVARCDPEGDVGEVEVAERDIGESHVATVERSGRVEGLIGAPRRRVRGLSSLRQRR